MPVNMKGKVHPKMKNNLVDGNQVSETRIRPVWSHLINFSFFFSFYMVKQVPSHVSCLVKCYHALSL